MESYKITFETWNNIAKLYEDKFMDLDLYDETYRIFCNLLPSYSSVLELGCGPGNVTKYILSNRPDVKVLATDIAPNMLQLAEENNPTAEFKLLDSRKITELKRTFDAILAGFCLPYLSAEDTEKLIRDTYKILHKDGVLYISVIEGDYKQSGYQTGSSGGKCYVYYHTAENLIAYLESAGFTILHTIRKEYMKGTDMESHLILIAQKGVV